ncbi:MAG: pirin family protein [Actinomycetota bacterium]|nr:pirin family protein [Actinomycetota bacterium]
MVKIEISGRSGELGGISIERFLPKAQLRTVGPWCFVDRMSNLSTPNLAAMEVAPHPHFGLATVTYLLNGEVEHRDSMGNRLSIKPGQINVMSAGVGVSHSEISTSGEALAGLQLWAALPQEKYLESPDFMHIPSALELESSDFSAELISGELLGSRLDIGLSRSCLGAVVTAKSTSFELPLNGHFEYVFIPISGDYLMDGIATPKAEFVSDATSVRFTGSLGSKFLLLGGEPFGERILMWWNFIGRSWEEIVEARRQWNDDEGRFGSFKSNYARIPAPDIVR